MPSLNINLDEALTTVNIDIPGYKPFIFDYTETSHGGTGFYVKDSFQIKIRHDLKFNSPSNFESTFIELIFLNTKKFIIGCIYRHPSSSVSLNHFTSDYTEPLLDKISLEGKMCSLVGDFNIDLLKCDTNDNINLFYNTLTSNFFAPYILQPTRFASESLIDNILINSIKYMSYSGNQTIQISDHLLQFVILEGFFKEVLPKKINLYERNFKNFNEREFDEALKNCDWDSILALDQNDPNLSMENLYNNTIFLLDEFAPYRKLSKKDYKLKSKPWINNEILTKIHERDKLLHKYSNAKDLSLKANLLKDYKNLRNSITKMKRDSKTKYYKEYFEIHKKKTASIWKGIRSC